MIYFIRAPKSRLVKIGYSSGHPSARLRSLQCGSAEKLELIGMLDGGRSVETEWHRRFAHLREHGEWFRWAVDLRKAARPHLFETVERKRRLAWERSRREIIEIYAMFPDWPGPDWAKPAQQVA